MTGVIELTQGWEPLGVVSVIEAIRKVFREKAFILDRSYTMHDWDSWVHTWEDAREVSRRMLRSPSVQIAGPEVIVQRTPAHKNLFKIAKLNRKNVLLRDNYTCQYCGQKLPSQELNIDHVIPKSKGGKLRWKNVVASCITCNGNLKQNRTPGEAGMPLRSRPYVPRWLDLKQREAFKRFETWEDIASEMYWNAELED
jgi:5-methylcytosine-specific restriction endonuclease McrA